MQSRVPVEVDAHAVEFDHALERAAGAAHQCPAARGELRGLERLRQEIVGADVERLDLVGEGAAGGEDQRGHGDAGASQAAHQGQPIGAGKPHVDHRESEFLGFDGRSRRLGAGDAMHRVIGRRQAARDGVGDDVVVLDD